MTEKKIDLPDKPGAMALAALQEFARLGYTFNSAGDGGDHNAEARHALADLRVLLSDYETVESARDILSEVMAERMSVQSVSVTLLLDALQRCADELEGCISAIEGEWSSTAAGERDALEEARSTIALVLGGRA